MNDYLTGGIPDRFFVRDSAPMTKEEIRAIAISKLALRRDSRIIDIGAGTGSMSIECALLASEGIVYAVEKDENALELLHKNREAFGVKNIHCIAGSAPEVLKKNDAFDRAFIGGSGGNLQEILLWIDAHIASGGIIVINAITLETVSAAHAFFKERGYEFEVIHVSIARSEKKGRSTMMKAMNPVFIMKAWEDR